MRCSDVQTENYPGNKSICLESNTVFSSTVIKVLKLPK